MEKVEIELDGKLVNIPLADLKWFLENTEAKEIKEKKVNNKKDKK